MKKILAIALAVAMVLSMASASAFFCDGINWNCNTNTVKCAKAGIEVVEMVRSNSACGFDFIESGCAAVVAGENVYFAIKVTVPEDVNPQWWAATTAQLKASKLFGGADIAYPAGTGAVALPAVNALDEGYTYWLSQDGATDASPFIAGVGPNALEWNKVTKSFSFDVNNVFSVRAATSAAKVCARLYTNEFNGHDANLEIGDYTAIFNKATSTNKLASFTITKGNYTANVTLDENDGKVMQIAVGGKTYVGYQTTAGVKFALANGAAEDMTCAEAKFVKDLMGVFGFDFGTCTTYKAVKKAFGFGGDDDVVADCSNYKVGTSAIIDAACEIEIPKTGDVSVIAYAVMALVAAAGAMGLKK